MTGVSTQLVPVVRDRHRYRGAMASSSNATASRSWSTWAVAPRSYVADVALWLVVCAPATAAPLRDGGSLGAIDAVAAVLALVLLVLRRRWPIPVLAVDLVALLVATAIAGHPTALLSASIVLLFAVAVRYDRTVAIRTAVAGTATLLGAVAILQARAFIGPELLAGIAWPTLAVAAGDAVRSRREAIAAADERARRAEETREEEARRRVAETRLQIARELHDVVAHRIAVINVQAGVAAHLMPTRPDDAAAALATVRASARDVLDELAEILGVLREPGADAAASTAPAPTLDDVPGLVASFADAGLRVAFETAGELHPLGDAATIALYRTVQEALTNAHKHGDGSARVRVVHGPIGVDVEVVNRVAPGRPPSTSGFGLLGMRERVQAVGGQLAIGPDGDGTFRVQAHFPRARTQEAM